MDHEYAAKPKEPSTSRKSLGRQCVAFGCNQYQYKMENGERIPTNVPMYRFPKEEELKNEWCKLIRREDGRDNFHVSQSTRLCAAHFRPVDFKTGGKTLKRPEAKPLLHSWNNFTWKQPRRPLVRRVNDTSCSSSLDEMVVEEAADDTIAIDFNMTPGDVDDIHCLGDLSGDIVVVIDEPSPVEKTIDDYKEEVIHLKARIVELEMEVDNLKKKKLTMKDIYANHILSNDGECTSATGFHSVDRLRQFYDFLDPGENGENVSMARSQEKINTGRPRILSPFEGYLLLLCRLKSAFSIKHLSFLFCASVGAIEAHFMMWLMYTYFKVASLSWWPSKDTVMNSMPASMKSKFPSVRTIIDCCEFPAESPGSLSLQKLFYSVYKSHVTVKVLVGIMPAGGITFISPAFPGSTSDRDIVIKSGILNPALYEMGDAIMADRGFTIKDLLEPMGVQLIIPAFLSGREQLSPEETVLTQQIASERIHVERAIQRLKSYHILDCVPVALYDSINEIITVCACFSNMQNPIIANK